MANPIPVFTTKSFLDMVRAADPEFDYEGKHHVCYEWPQGNQRRDPGAGGGPYANNPA
jgi:hypothetical protein